MWVFTCEDPLCSVRTSLKSSMSATAPARTASGATPPTRACFGSCGAFFDPRALGALVAALAPPFVREASAPDLPAGPVAEADGASRPQIAAAANGTSAGRGASQLLKVFRRGVEDSLIGVSGSGTAATAE